MRGALLAAALLLATACSSSTPDARPDHLLDVGVVQRIDVREPGTGRTWTFQPSRRLAADLQPLLAVRTLARRRAGYGLDPPRLVAVVRGRAGRARLVVGAPNFDGTAVYVATGGRVALVLPRVVRALRQAAP